MYFRTNSTFYRLSSPALNLVSLIFKTVSFFNLKIKALQQKHFPQLFIISVDSLSFGGTGKTPMVMAIGRALEKKFVPFAIVSRGYRSGYEKKGALVGLNQSAEEVGDEPWLFKKRFPNRDIIIGRNRLQSIALAAARKNRIVILDDGLQTSQIRKDFSVMLINPEHPYFYLRNFKFLAQYEHAVLSYRRAWQAKGSAQKGNYSFAIENFYDSRDQKIAIGAARIIAFSALGDNERFKNDMGDYQLAAFRGFADHHAFSSTDLQNLEKLRTAKGAAWMVCTEKDFCKLNKFLDASIPLIYVRNRIELTDDTIEQIIKHAAEKGFL